MASAKLSFVLPTETAKMARALDGITGADRQFVADACAFFGVEQLDTEDVSVAKDAGLLAMRIERMSEADRNVMKGLVSRIMARNKDKPGSGNSLEKGGSTAKSRT